MEPPLKFFVYTSSLFDELCANCIARIYWLYIHTLCGRLFFPKKIFIYSKNNQDLWSAKNDLKQMSG